MGRYVFPLTGERRKKEGFIILSYRGVGAAIPKLEREKGGDLGHFSSQGRREKKKEAGSPKRRDDVSFVFPAWKEKSSRKNN